MHDKDLAIEILLQIETAAQKVVQRFEVINSPDDFTGTAAGYNQKKYQGFKSRILFLSFILSEELFKTTHSNNLNTPGEPVISGLAG